MLERGQGNHMAKGGKSKAIKGPILGAGALVHTRERITKLRPLVEGRGEDVLSQESLGKAWGAGKRKTHTRVERIEGAVPRGLGRGEKGWEGGRGEIPAVDGRKSRIFERKEGEERETRKQNLQQKGGERKSLTLAAREI